MSPISRWRKDGGRAAVVVYGFAASAAGEAFFAMTIVFHAIAIGRFK
jgi:hypothetical protein